MKAPRTMPEKPQDRKRVLIRLGGYLMRHVRMVIAALLLTITSNLLALIGPALSGRAIDAIGSEAGKVDFPTVFYYCGLMLVFYLVSSVLSYILSVLMIHLSQKIVYQMREDVFNHLTELPVRYFDSHQTGDIVSRISYDIDTVNASLSTDLLQIATSAITVGGSLVMMILISPELVLVFAVTIPTSIFFTRYMVRKVRPLFRKRSIKLGELNGYVEEIITGQKTIKAYHQEETMIGRFDQRNKEAVDAYYMADYYGSMTGPSVNFINNLSLALISTFGAILFLFGHISLGNLSSFVLYSRKFSGPINEMANIISELQSACAAAERVFRLIDEPPETPDLPQALEVTSVDGRVDIEHVKFGYDPQRTIIHDLNLTAKPGSLVAIVGPTGAGKTTIINLLMRFYDPDSGEIRLDGHEIRHITRKSLRLSYAMVLQDTWLFHGTVFENIAYGKKGATLEDVTAAAKAARIHHYITRLPDGYDTILNEDGMNISQGQKQLLTIARAMLLDARMLILDEATSNVDTRTEQQIQAAMRTLMEGKTCFVIAHRLSTIQNADTILVVRDGEIVEQGNHQELMQRGGVYAGLYRSQFQ
ncbi:MAG TPA: ABC transporter ATP-binding protein [Candidatus Gallacutalibacter pullicola]|uniref:ABC transporter ATP-binding protein n=1 Tax=Candidatus Gallacutalibacter pullicola TaxID=2840830 RepID=A0A9D1J180_9FIRM|nr:ABC transporter ATP-binding protein [Candidatus Gallacutalibacter pullicola]